MNQLVIDGSWLLAQGSWLLAHGQDGAGMTMGPGLGPDLGAHPQAPGLDRSALAKSVDPSAMSHEQQTSNSGLINRSIIVKSVPLL